MKYYKPTLSLIVCALTAVQLSAQTTVNNTQKKKNNDAASKSIEQRQDPIQLANEIASLVYSYKDARTKSLALSQLAEVVWSTDESAARQFMQKALDSCALNDSMKAEERRSLLSRRNTLIGIISKHDTDWAERLIDEDETLSESERQSANIATAYKLLDESTPKSISFINRSSKTGLPQDFPFYLQALRSRNPSAADNLFGTALAQLAQQPLVNAETVLAFGTYSYSAPGKDPYTISVRAIGDAMLYDLSIDREGVPLKVTKAYLATAAFLLERNKQTADPSEAALSYYASRLLLEKALQVAPELASQFRSNLDVNSTSVPEAFKTSASSGESRSPRSGQESESDQNDDRNLAVFYDRWLQKDYEASQKTLDKFFSSGLRTDLQRLLSFRRIADGIDRGDPMAKIRSSIIAMPQGLESAVLWFGLASQYARQPTPLNLTKAKESLVMSVNASSQVRDFRRAYLLINVAKIYASFDSAMAHLVFKDAVRQFNALEAAAPTSYGWQQKIEADNLSREFSLRLKNMSTDLTEVIPDLAGDEASDVYSDLLTLKDEKLQARSLISYLKFAFNRQVPKV
jgi:hypothetical protein